jgi:hypothetical protein
METEHDGVDWIQVTQDREQWMSPLNKVRIIKIKQK